jgi:hypothetical protein
MAYYDSYTAQAAQTALGRSLAAFYTQDDDPTVNGSADANFLARLIKTHIDSIRTTVLAAYSGAKFKLLWPLRCELRDVLLHTGRSIPAGRAPKSRRQSPVAVFGAGWIGPRIA